MGIPFAHWLNLLWQLHVYTHTTLASWWLTCSQMETKNNQHLHNPPHCFHSLRLWQLSYLDSSFRWGWVYASSYHLVELYSGHLGLACTLYLVSFISLKCRGFWTYRSSASSSRRVVSGQRFAFRSYHLSQMQDNIRSCFFFCDSERARCHSSGHTGYL